MWRNFAGVVVGALLSLPFFGAFAARSADAQSLGACWTPEQLLTRPGEEKVRKGIAAAFRDPPRGHLRPYAAIPRSERLSIRRFKLPPGKNWIALTFDLCEQPHEIAGYEGTIVDFLRAEHIRATFFVGGKWMLTHPERTRQLIADPLFEIGNHTWEHRNLKMLQGSALNAEIESTQLAYEQAWSSLKGAQCLLDSPAGSKGSPPLTLFRFPFGRCDNRSLDVVGEYGLRAIQWDVSSGDPWRGLQPEAMVKDVVKRVRPGSIVLFHANGRGFATPKALPAIVKRLREEGYEFKTIGDMMADPEAVPELKPDCYNEVPGDTAKYDKLFQTIERTSELAARKLKRPESGSDVPLAPPPLEVPPAKKIKIIRSN